VEKNGTMENILSTWQEKAGCRCKRHMARMMQAVILRKVGGGDPPSAAVVEVPAALCTARHCCQIIMD
jgi:hypothetical protein